jgi:superoxide dismutase, Fe-Mn family
MSDRRDFLKKSGLLSMSFLASRLVSEEKLNALENISNAGGKPFSLPELPYTYDALEPFFDKQTMEIHHTKHHKGYVDKLNDTPSTNIDYTADDATKCTHVNSTTSAVIRNNLGGHYNHTLFWTLLKPNPKGEKNLPGTELDKAIKKDFKSFDDLKNEFSEKASKIFGSGWCWLIEKDGKLKITTTANQDNPLMSLNQERGKIILGLDVWEHAYYLKYQNKRADYISNWWNIVNWEKAEELYKTK